MRPDGATPGTEGAARAAPQEPRRTELTEALVARLPARREPAEPPPAMPEAAMRAALREALAARGPGPVRLFAFGALMWEREALRGAAAEPALLAGHARSFCLEDIHARGVPGAPGLTTGLVAREGAATGGVLLTLPEPAEEALWPAWRQEMRPGFYRAAWAEVVPRGGGAARALGFLADRGHPLWRGEVPEAAAAEVLAQAVGPAGPAADYLRRSVETLRAIGLPDAGLERLARAVAARLRAAA